MSSSPASFRSIYRALLRELPPRPLLSSSRPFLFRVLHDSFSDESATTVSTTTAPTTTPTTAPTSKKQDMTKTRSTDKTNDKTNSTNNFCVTADPALAEQFVSYLRAQHMYAALLERYNPGMGMDQEKRIRLTARRVGMDLPAEYDPDEPPQGSESKD